jgi:hypothetical protein
VLDKIQGLGYFFHRIRFQAAKVRKMRL